MAAVILEYFNTFLTCFLLVVFLRKSFRLEAFSKKFFLLWAQFGFWFGLYSFSWLYTVYPLPWLPHGGLQILGLGIIHFLLACLCAISYSIVGLNFHERIPKQFRIIIFALSLLVAELVRSLLISLLFSGNGGSVGLHWTASTIGSSLSTTPLIEYAYFGGTYGLTFILGVIIYIWTSPFKQKIRYLYSTVILIGLLVIHIGLPVSGPKKSTDIAVITTDMPNPKQGEDLGMMFAKNYVHMHSLTKSLTINPPDIVVYPEDARYITYTDKKRMGELLPALNETLFIDGNTTIENEKLSNISVFFKQNKQEETRNKLFLFPFNEYTPSLFSSIFIFFIGKENVENYTKTHTYTPLSELSIYEDRGVRIATIICSEILSFETVRKISHEKPDIIFFQSQLSVFHNHPLFVSNLRSFAKIAAAQIRTPFISSTNYAPSLIISPYGEIIDTIPVSFSVHRYIVYKSTLTPKQLIKETVNNFQ